MAAQCVASQAVAARATVAPRHQNNVRKAAGVRSRAVAAVPTRRVGGRGVIAAASGDAAEVVMGEVVRNPRPEYVPARIDDPEYVRIFDTTLRDGEQSPGATLVCEPLPAPLSCQPLTS